MQTKYFDNDSVMKVQIEQAPSSGLSLIIVIPAMNETQLLESLGALKSCTPPRGDVEVIVVINHCLGAAQSIVDTNVATRMTAQEWATKYSTESLCFHILYHPDLPTKKGGVGMARKIGMDEAARRFLASGNPEGVITCFDADCLCEPNYLHELEAYFSTHPETEGVSIYFEHPIDGLEEDARNAIVHYELHLRYFIDAQRWAQYPFAYQTVGSSMAVRASVYTKVGGMNTRKAGEDFYFLHKIIERGAHADMNSTTVYPSARSSDRVPFGTGKAVADMLNGAAATTYNPASFEDLKAFIIEVPGFYSAPDSRRALQNLPKSVKEFLLSQQFEKALSEIKKNTASQESFEKRFFKWFNAFRLMKYVHFARDHYYPDVKIEEGVDWLFRQAGIARVASIHETLMRLREFDRTG